MEINPYRILLTLISIALLLYLLAGALLYFFQRQFIYFPTPKSAHNFEEIIFNINDAKISVIAIERDTRSAVIYFGGNAENVAYSATELSNVLTDHSLYLVNYRGYGGSTGQPSESTLYNDALLIFDALQARYDHIAIIGRSLGSSVATFVASQRSVSKLVLVTPFDSIRSIAQRSYPIFPVTLLLKDTYDSASSAVTIRSPTLIMVAEQDQIIPLDHTRRLIASFRQTNPQMVALEQSDHNSVSNHPAYYPALKDFLNTE